MAGGRRAGRCAPRRSRFLRADSRANVNCALLLATTSRGIPLLRSRDRVPCSENPTTTPAYEQREREQIRRLRKLHACARDYATTRYVRRTSWSISSRWIYHLGKSRGHRLTLERIFLDVKLPGLWQRLISLRKSAATEIPGENDIGAGRATGRQLVVEELHQSRFSLTTKAWKSRRER